MDPLSPVADDEIVLRHIPGGTTFQAPGPRLTSKNFALRAGEVGLSVSRAAFTTPAALMARVGDPAKGSRVAHATAGEVRALGLELVPAPLFPDDPGHAEIRPVTASLDEHTTRKRMALLFEFLPDDPPSAGS